MSKWTFAMNSFPAIRASHSESTPSITTPASFASYLELASTTIPRRKTGIKQMLRPGCPYIPLPLSLGWEANPLDLDYPSEELVIGLMLSDIESGATRPVVSPWMHALYKHTLNSNPSGATKIRLKEANFTSIPGKHHGIILCVVAAQFVVMLYALGTQQLRESALLVAGLSLQVLEGIYDWACPKYEPPRRVQRQRFYALHKGMTTKHVLLVYHTPLPWQRGRRYASRMLRNINLEDAAVPQERVPNERRASLEMLCGRAIRLGNWGFRAACIFSASNSFLIPLTLLIGSVAIEAIAALMMMKSSTVLPRHSEPTILETTEKEPSLLDMVLAVCQATGYVSIGFVESILPDRDGTHLDYKWISDVMRRGVLNAGPHPDHQRTNTVFSSALRRRTTPRPEVKDKEQGIT
ncbi:hypothetical protein BDQ12DRAFT_693708 [Crucibulum laeve]|uniref:Uncharacterized protein n=1 Tax=Crucibulum laeve TaxID=68775 RepID=A0A5C3LSD0_9AGAR|nr:hypothetical protein BDQ12DRAFT_693708 [Crucibulum laeve]